MDRDWTNLLETTFNQVSDILGETSVEDEMIAGEEEMAPVEEDMILGDEDMIEHAVTIDMLSDSRLDANSVLIEDIVLGEEDARREAEVERVVRPLQRDRCNSWHGREYPLSGSCSPTGSHSSGSSIPPTLEGVSEEAAGSEDDERPNSPSAEEANSKSKLNTRKNPWGNHSYAELIAQAIQSSSEGRLTLSQIYDWMIASVPYFAQRADTSSAAGWKNSIRHNLSLHQRFQKVQNEGAGKSSWWTLNPEKKLGAKPRRRATSGDVKSLALRRERARRRREALGPGEAYRAPGETWRALEQAHIPPFSSLGRLGEAGLELREPVTAGLLGLSLARREEDQGHGVRLARRQEQGQGALRIKILEARDPSPPSPVLPYPPPTTYLTPQPLPGARRPMLLQEVDSPARRRLELQPWHRQHLGGETAFDRKIRLLQEELDKMSREEEILTINQYASASNNPFFMGGEGTMKKEASSTTTLRPRGEDVMAALLAQELAGHRQQQYREDLQGGHGLRTPLQTVS